METLPLVTAVEGPSSADRFFGGGGGGLDCFLVAGCCGVGWHQDGDEVVLMSAHM